MNEKKEDDIVGLIRNQQQEIIDLTKWVLSTDKYVQYFKENYGLDFDGDPIAPREHLNDSVLAAALAKGRG